MLALPVFFPFSFQRLAASRPAARAAADKRATVEALYREYFQRIYRYCLRRVGSEQEAEDVTSLVFTRAFTGLDSLRGDSTAAWLFRIAHNAVLNHLRDRRTTEPLEGAEERASDEVHVLDRMVETETHERLARLIARLPEDQQELLTLKITGELSAREIGQVVGKSEAAVRVAIFRIVRELREEWELAEGASER